MKFKVGDRVRCLRATNYQYINIGQIYTIKHINKSGTVVLREIEKDHNYTQNRFEPLDIDHFRDELFTI